MKKIQLHPFPMAVASPWVSVHWMCAWRSSWAAPGHRDPAGRATGGPGSSGDSSPPGWRGSPSWGHCWPTTRQGDSGWLKRFCLVWGLFLVGWKLQGFAAPHRLAGAVGQLPAPPSDSDWDSSWEEERRSCPGGKHYKCRYKASCQVRMHKF